MKKHLSLFAAVLLLSSLSAFADAKAKSALTLPISGTFTDAAAGTGTFTGTFKLLNFEAVGDQIMANGVLSGTLTNSLGVPLGSVTKSVSLPVSFGSVATVAKAAARAVTSNATTCDILTLVLGPLHLDLLGLTVDLNQVVLNIDANTGGGNLLGNLLCSVVSLLDGAGSLVDIANLLNQILTILSGLLG